MLNIKNLSVKVNNKEILKDFNLIINDGEIHALMGLNGAGKSSICKTIMGDEEYIVTNGEIIYNGVNLLTLKTDERARLGIFYLCQNPIEISGVSNAEMLRSICSNTSLFDFNEEMLDICKRLDIPKSFIHRGINEGMSGGERKKNELLQMFMLKPKLLILDELDSGLDVDSLKSVCTSINNYYDNTVSILLVTHHAALVKELNAKYVHILSDGKIILNGTEKLSETIENNGYKDIIGTNRVSKNEEEE